ncbi:MAG: GDP-L-fucose synthase [Acidobacteriia bacterium]|nr:GDP-L-fucose synthase [Terriglobia bacterium]
MDLSSRIFVTGHRGLVGSGILQKLTGSNYVNLQTRPRAELDLTHADAVSRFFAQHRPEFVFLCAAKVGGILANATYPADFIRENLAIQSNVIEASRRAGVRRLLFLGSSCIYPRDCPQPIKEEYLLSGPLESTNRAYAIAKIAGIEMCRSYNQQYGTHYLSVMPTNLYGPGDNFDLETSHVLPALVRKVHEARREGRPSITVWGTGKARREFLYSEDLADAAVFLMNLPGEAFENACRQDPPLLNIGCGEDLTIQDLVALVMETVGYRGSVVYDSSKPDGTARKLLDVSRMRALGWSPRTPLREGLALFYSAFLKEHSGGRA